MLLERAIIGVACAVWLVLCVSDHRMMLHLLISINAIDHGEYKTTLYSILYNAVQLLNIVYCIALYCKIRFGIMRYLCRSAMVVMGYTHGM